MKKQDRIKRDIGFAERQLQLKEKYVPQLLANVTNQEHIDIYMKSIEELKNRIASLSSQLEPETPIYNRAYVDRLFRDGMNDY